MAEATPPIGLHVRPKAAPTSLAEDARRDMNRGGRRAGPTTRREPHTGRAARHDGPAAGPRVSWRNERSRGRGTRPVPGRDGRLARGLTAAFYTASAFGALYTRGSHRT
jgi:hypothetical protein